MSGFVIYRQVTGNLSQESEKYTLAGLDVYTKGCFNAITKNSEYIYAAGSYVNEDNINSPILYRQPINNLSDGGQVYTLKNIQPNNTYFTGIQINSKYIYLVGKTSETTFIYRQPIDNLSEGGEQYNIGLGIYMFSNLQIDSNYIYAISESNDSILYRQPINNLSGGGEQYTLVGDNLILNNLAIDSKYIYLVGTGLIYRQPIDNLSGGGEKYILNGLDSYDVVGFFDLKINDGYIYACGVGVINSIPDGIVYKQSIMGAKYANP